MKNILFVASEAVPFIKTGGLADVVGSLPKYFDKRYFDCRVIIPKYLCMKQEFKDNSFLYVLFGKRSLCGNTQDRSRGNNILLRGQ